MTICTLDVLLFLFGTSPCSMSSYNCCFLTCIQISQETDQGVWYSYLFRIFHSLLWSTQSKTLARSIKQKYMFFWNSLAFLMIQQMLEIWFLIPLPLLKPAWMSASSWFMYYWSLAWRILSITLLLCEMSVIVHSLSMLWCSLVLRLKWKLIFSSLWPLLICWHIVEVLEHFHSIMF